MSLVYVLPHFATQCRALGYQEHEDALNWRNIPASRVDKAFHLELGDTTNQKTDMWLLTLETPVTVRLFVKAGRDTKAARTKAIVDAKALIEQCTKATSVANSNLKGVYYESTALVPIDDSNDNTLMIETKFTALTVLDIEGA